MSENETEILKFFVDRRSEITTILNFVNDIINRDNKHLLYITGIGGIGKSTLLRYILWRYSRELEDEAILTFYIDIADRIPITRHLFLLAQKLSQLGVSTDLFYYFYTVYMKCVEGVEPTEITGFPDSFKNILEEIIKQFIPGPLVEIGKLVGQAVQKLFGKRKRVLNWLRENFGENYQEKIAWLIINRPKLLLQYMVRALAEDINNAINHGKINALLLLVDTAESLKHDDIITIVELFDCIKRILLIIAGREINKKLITHSKIVKYRPIIEHHRLLAISEAAAREYLEKRGICDKNLQDVIIEETGAIPQLLAVATELVNELQALGVSITPEIFKGEAETWREKLYEYIDRLLSHLKPNERELVIVSAIPRSFNKRILEVMIGRKIFEMEFKKLVTKSFYTSSEIRKDVYLIHDEVRSAVLRALSRDDFEHYGYKAIEYLWQEYQRSRDPYYSIELIYILQQIDEKEALKYLDKMFKYFFENAMYETCLQLLDTYNPKIEVNKAEKAWRYGLVLLKLFELDSALAILNEFKDFEVKDLASGKIKATIYKLLGEIHMEKGEYNIAIEYLNKAIEIIDGLAKSTREEDIETFILKSEILDLLVYIHRDRLQQLDQSMMYLNKMIETCDKVLKLTNGQHAYAMFLKGLAYRRLSDILRDKKKFNRSIEFAQEAIELFNKAIKLTKDKYVDILVEKVSTFDALGCSLDALGELEKALEIFREGIKTCDKILIITNKRHIFASLKKAALLDSVVSVLIELQRYDEALETLIQAENACEQVLKLTHNLYIEAWMFKGLILRRKSQILKIKGDLKRALEVAREALNAYKMVLEITNGKDNIAWKGQGDVLLVLGEILLDSNRPNESINILNKAIEAFDRALSLACLLYTSPSPRDRG